MTRPRSSLPGDSHGAIMVMALFMAVVAAGGLYYLMGIGDAILMRERMQDAADASAFSGAIVHARGMNILALFNIMMAGLLAALILLKMLAAALLAIGEALGAAWFIPGAAAAGIALINLGAGMEAKMPAAERTVEAVLKTLDAGSDAVRNVVPLVAEMKVIPYAKERYSPPVEFAVIAPLQRSLPTVDGTFDRLCAKAGDYAASAIKKITDFILGAVPGGDFLSDLVDGFTRKLVRTFSSYLCGKSPTPPSIEYEKQTPYPQVGNPHIGACERGGDPSACKKSGELENKIQGAFDFESGECSSADAEITSICEQRRLLARKQCHPHDGVDDLDEWRWRQVEVDLIYVLEGPEGAQRVVFKEAREVAATAQEMTLERWREKHKVAWAPCFEGTGVVNAWSDWNRSPDQPVCRSTHSKPSIFELRDDPDGQVEIRVSEVSDVVACTATTTAELDLDAKPISDKMKKAEPEEICNCAELGEELFQLRAGVKGDPEEFLARRRQQIQVADLYSSGDTWEQSGVEDLLDAAGDLAVAQAEYYVADEHAAERDEWMWHMHWKARLRRFNFVQTTGWTCPERNDDCPEPWISITQICGGSCEQLLSTVDTLVLH